MTRAERLKHIVQGKRVLKARRNPKLNTWEITLYNGTSYNTYNWDKYETRDLCEAEIARLQRVYPAMFVGELSPGLTSVLPKSNRPVLPASKDLLINRRSNGMTYRQCFGCVNPPAGTLLSLDFADGIGFFIMWDDCPDGENIIEGWFKTREDAEEYIKSHGWRW